MGKVKSARLALAAVVCMGLIWNSTAYGEEPVTIRAGCVVVPACILPVMFPKPDTARHNGKSYRLNVTRFKGVPPMITALATGDLDIAEMGFSTIGVAVENAGLDDIRIIADEIRDGMPGYAQSTFEVRTDSPINKVEDLKGKAIATNAIRSGDDVIIRAVLQLHGLHATRDYTEVEVPFSHMRAMLIERKIDLASFVVPFLYQPGLDRIARPLFEHNEAFGPTEVAFLTARAGFIAKNRKAMVDFLEDYVRATRWYLDPANHKEAVSVVAKYTKLPPGDLDSWLFTKKDYYRNPNGLPDLRALQKNVAGVVQQGFLKANFEVTDYADLSLIEEAVQRLK